MNKKVWITLLSVLIGVLVVYNIIKFVFPETFIMCLTNTKTLELGTFIEKRWWLEEIYFYVTGFISFYLFGCISKQKWYLNWKETLLVFGLNIISQLLYAYVQEVSVYAGIGTLLIIPLFIDKNIKGFIITFQIYNICQYLLLFVRGYIEALPLMNIASQICVGTESLVILFCFYIYFNVKEKKNEQSLSTNN